ncbi:CheW-like domain protein [Vibrio aerogenes CECT 7868]|uniref:CheW-like domain protein n=1 Tax=Vibrio aerogenes CECT 7868 TaxID=1216006 RepID=A0A1M6CW02_9VIBR|nr:chemotaxis protein CheW [Vibrio aerogenes]SHI65187.1 CheW-like domain protein [Vibrio aerogenes CECT 7868]
MSRDMVLSSEQALDDYFAALLDEESGDLELVQEKKPESPSQLSKETEVVPQLQKQRVAEHVAETGDSYTLPNLEDVQRLLNQLESTNPVDQIEDIEELLDKNTDKIASQIQVSENTVAALAEVAEETLSPSVEEIQEWDISVQSDDVVEVKTEISEVTETVTDSQPEAIVAEPEIKTESFYAEPAVETEQEQEISYRQENETETAQDTSQDIETQAEGKANHWKSIERKERFQILYFEVNGVMFAVPLDELGGIHRLETLNHLIGRPPWYLGLQTNRDNQLDVVDTACWVMADKLTDENYKSGYQYIVMLGDSSWGLACDHLKGTELLDSEKVRWREKAGKRPWLAGMVKERMCALIHVEALIEMLKAGLDVKALDN